MSPGQQIAARTAEPGRSLLVRHRGQLGDVRGEVGAADPLVLRRAMIHATATASFCVEAVGTAKIARVTRADVAARVAAIRALYDFGASTM